MAFVAELLLWALLIKTLYTKSAIRRAGRNYTCGAVPGPNRTTEACGKIKITVEFRTAGKIFTFKILNSLCLGNQIITSIYLAVV
jgi:hypothetical protein